MKKFFCRSFLLFNFLSTEVFAEDDLSQEDAAQGVLKMIIKEDPNQFLGKESSAFSFQPKFSNRFISDVRFDDNYQSTEKADEYKDTQFKGRLYSKLSLNKNLAINGYFRMKEFNKTAANGKDRTFKDEGLYIEELNVTYNDNKYAFIAGKFDLNFGTAWRWDRGIWSYETAQNYKQTEKLGFNGIYRLGDSKTVGEYQFGFGVFTNDRKNLDNSILVSRTSASKSDAVPGDTRSLKSYVASLDINYDFGGHEKLSYHFSYIDLAVNNRASSVTPTKIDDQKGFALGMNYKHPVTENFTVDWLLEYASIKNFGGDSDISENYLTTNIIGRIYQNWLVTLGYSDRDNSEVDAAGFDQNLSEISFGYEFGKALFFDKLVLQAGYKNQRTNYKTSLETQNVFGGLLRLYKNF